MSGIDFINYECQKEAYESGVSGLFRSFLSFPKDNGMKISAIGKSPYDRIVNLKNETLYKTWKSIFKRSKVSESSKTTSNNGTLFPYVYSFNGRNVILDDHWYMPIHAYIRIIFGIILFLYKKSRKLHCF